jgi:ribosomal protein S18 acetylase RimI-like enzyme
VSVGPDQYGGGSGDRPECRKLPRAVVFGVDQLNPICPRSDVEAAGLTAYLEELYVVPERRGQGLGRALLEAAMDHARERGAARIDLNTSVDDVAARALYESAGFTNREGGPEGPPMLYYERDL